MMGEGTRVVEYADDKRVDELALIIARLESRIAILEKRQLSGVTVGSSNLNAAMSLLEWDEESKSYKGTAKF